MSLQIAGTTRIFAKEVNGKTLYSTSISSKKKDGSYDRMYITVQLPKDITVQNNTDIMILEGFMSFYKNKDGLALPKLVVMKYEIENKEQARGVISSESIIASPDGTDNLNDDLPF